MQTHLQYPSTDGIQLDGVLLETEVPKRAVLMLHGINSSKEEPLYPLFADRLLPLGINSFRFDFRGHGKSTGQSEEMTIRGEVDDAAASLRLIRERWALPVSIIAASFGAATALMLLEKYGTEGIESLVLLNPVLDLERTFLKPELPWAKRSFHEEGFRSLKEKGYLLIDGHFRVGKSLIEEMETIRPYEVLRSLNLPTLTLHGDRDTFVSYDIARQYGRPNSRSRFVTIPGAEHGFGRPEDTRLLTETVVGWFATM